MVAIVGVFTAFIVIRGRARTRKSVYSTLRSDRELRVRAARERALASQAPVAGSTQTVAEPVAAAPPAQPAWDVSATSPAPAPAVEPPTPVAPPGEPATEQQPVATSAPARPEGWRQVPHAEKRELAGQSPGQDGDLKVNMTQQILSYAGLVAALGVVLLGVVLMIASSR